MKTLKLRMAALLGTALSALLLFTACPNNAGGGGSSTVNITVKGNANVNVPSKPVAVLKGAKWAEVKSTVKSKVSTQTGFLIVSWHLGADESAPELKDTDMFVKDTTVFVKSRANLPDLSPIQGSGTQVKITFGVTPEGGGSILGPNPISVNKGTRWNSVLKAYAEAALKVNYGFQCNGWKKDGNPVNDTYTFDGDTTILAELKDMRIYLTVKGDSNVTVNNPTGTIVIKSGVKWQSIKGTVAAKVSVNKPNYVITKWHLGTGASDPVLTDEYEFKKEDGQNRTVYAETVGSTVNITVKGDEHIDLPAEPVAVRAGAKWAEAKSTVQGKVSPKPNFLIDTWHLGEDENAPELKDTDMFVKDTTVFVKSRADLPDLSPIQGSGTQVKITFGVTPAGGGAILGPNPISVNKNTPWNPLLKAYAAAALKVNTGYELVGWKKNGTELDDTFSFDDDANVFAELKDMRIYLTVKGDSHVTVNNPTETIVIKSGVKWQSIKGTVAAKVTVNDPANFAVTAWHKGTSASDPVLTDDYEFTMADAPNCTVYAETGDKRITVTVKYGNGSGSPTTPAGTITVFDGKKWSEVKAEAAAKLNLPYGVVIQKWHWNDAGGQEISANHIFKASDGPRTVYAKVFDKRITVTVKYGKVGTENPPTAGTITVLNGDTWSTVKQKAQNTLPSSALAHGATILKWQWNDAGGQEISANHTFKVSDGATKTVYALIRPRIVYYKENVIRLDFDAPESGTVADRHYYLDKIPAVTNGTLGQSEETDNQEHQVSLDAYWMADGEVTQQLYELVMGTNPSHFQGPSYPPYGDEIQERRPVEQVNWYEAVAFCNELTRCCSTLEESDCVYTVEGHTYTVQDAKAKKVPTMNRSKKGFRLPTEAEWEWAAQGGIERLLYPAGEPIDDYIWHQSNSGIITHQGFKKKSHPKFPLDDMGGNVAEWCWDWYKNETPAGGTNPTGVPSGTKRIKRGGSIGVHYSSCKCAYRSYGVPETKYQFTGLRIVCRD